MKKNKPLSAYLSNIFKSNRLPEPGIYHYRLEGTDHKSRLHLRIDPDNQGLLIINANRVVHLNPSAALMVFMHLEGMTAGKASQIISKHFNIDRKVGKQDFIKIQSQIEEFLNPNGGCPVCDMGLETIAPFSAKPSAPYRMDLALTYRCNNDCSHCYNARSRHFPELGIDNWKRIIDKIWELGIPHIVFTGGEPTLYQGLPDLIAYAEKKGVITGLNTNGRKLSDQSFVSTLKDAGLDHVQITLESHDPNIHDRMVNAHGAWDETVAGLKNVLESNLYVMTNTTLLAENSTQIDETLSFLDNLGVPTIGLNALIYSGKGETVGTGLDEKQLPALLEKARRFTDSSGQRLIWYTPTQYCHFNPIQLNLGVKGCTAALYNMCIEPNGDVIPCQSYYQSLGNFIENSWKTIWEHPLALKLRNRTDLPEECRTCDFLPECGGGCPLARDHQHAQTINNPILSILRE